MDGLMDGWMDIDGLMDGWVDGWMDGWMDGQVCPSTFYLNNKSYYNVMWVIVILLRDIILHNYKNSSLIITLMCCVWVSVYFIMIFIASS